MRDVSLLVWIVTIAGIALLAAFDLLVVGRRRGPVGTAQAAKWIIWYVTLAVAFSVFLLLHYGRLANNEFLASYLTEYSLSADNIFVFTLLIGRFKVPAVAIDRVLYVGILMSLTLRAGLIAAGSAAISAFSWVFYLFGAFLLYTAVKLAITPDDDPPVATETRTVRALRRILRTSEEYDGNRFITKVDGRRIFTPAALVIGAIAIADVVFALDSIPAVFGITKNGYLVLTANAFAMLGMRQLYYLIGDLLKRMRYLSQGLAVLLGFIGVKLIFEALHGSHIERIGAVRVPVISATVSLAVVLGVLAVTAAASLLPRPRAEQPTSSVDRDAEGTNDR